MVDPLNPHFAATMTRGKVVTTSGQEIIGNIYIPMDFKLQLDFGTLSLAASKLRSITFTDAERRPGRPRPTSHPPRATEEARTVVEPAALFPARAFRHRRLARQETESRSTIWRPRNRRRSSSLGRRTPRSRSFPFLARTSWLWP